MIKFAQYAGIRPEWKGSALHAAGTRHRGEVHPGRTDEMHILHKEPTPYMDAWANGTISKWRDPPIIWSEAIVPA